MSGSRPRLVLVDGSGFIFRAFHALPPMVRSDGVPVNAVFGFCNMLTRLLADHTGTHLAVIFDAGRVTFRNRIDPNYKAHRPEPPDELIPQFALIREATRAFGVPAIELDDYEADDLIASYACAMTARGGETVIVSSDKDLMQLINGHVSMLDPIRQNPILADDVLAKFGVGPEKMIDIQALMGDAVDNVPGVPGIGPKGACQLITEYGTLEAALEAARTGVMKPSKRRDLLVRHEADALRSKQLVTLSCDTPLPVPIDELAVRSWDQAVLAGFLDAQGFKSIRARIGTERAAPPPEPARELILQPGSMAGFGPYETITTYAALAAWIDEARTLGRFVIDTQTNTLDARRGPLAGIALALGPGRAAYIPVGHESGEQLPREAVLGALSPLLVDPSVLKIFYNAKFSLHVLAGAGFHDVAPLDDAMLISYAMGAGAHGHGIGELAELHLAHKPITLNETTGTGRNRLGFAFISIDRASAYAAEYADVTFRLWEMLRPRLRGEKSLAIYETLERRLIPVLRAMEHEGVKVNADDLRAMSAEFERRMAEIERDVHRLAGREFSLGSPKQLGDILFGELGLPGGKRTKSGAWGTDVAVLEELAEAGHELPARLMDWRQLQKLKSTYADALVEEIDPSTGRVHTRMEQAVTSTGRLSSTEPNLQNIPIRTEEGGRIRRAFIAEPGRLLISADYSQIELRLLAHAANIESLRRSFAEGEDIHARTASEVFGVPMAGMDAATRRRAKAINFGIIYGISSFGLARQLNITPGEAKLYIDAYFQRYPEIRRYMNETREAARINGYVVTPLGRRCYIPGIRDKIASRRAYAERQASNAPLQGGAADIIKRAMVRLPRALRENGFRGRLILQVHDELLFEAPEAEAESIAALAKQVMQDAASLSVPLLVETGIGRNWSEAH
ncbi:MAG TPA: DNA polymerase I [Acetobacteraceae bacterium]|nr:DNA polymerase I [Acetobacteraceae bacterium]